MLLHALDDLVLKNVDLRCIFVDIVFRILPISIAIEDRHRDPLTMDIFHQADISVIEKRSRRRFNIAKIRSPGLKFVLDLFNGLFTGLEIVIHPAYGNDLDTKCFEGLEHF